MSQLSFSETEIQKLFGHEAAEDEEPTRLQQYYFKTSVYDQVVTDLPIRLLVSHKGIGKSALFRIAMQEDAESERLAILVRPDDVVGIGTETSEFLTAIRNWKDGLQDIIATKVLASVGVGASDLKSRARRYGSLVLSYLTETFHDSGLNYNPTKRAIVDNFLKSGKIRIYIDDLDRGWQGRQEDVQRISALLNAVRDLVSENRGLQFRISLRSDVYYLVRTSDESTDKIEGSVVWQSWTNHEILVLLIKRIETFFGRTVDEHALLKRPQALLDDFLRPIMEPRFNGQGKWLNVLSADLVLVFVQFFSAAVNGRRSLARAPSISQSGVAALSAP